MRRRERTRVLVRGAAELRQRLAGEIAGRHEIYTVAEPTQGLVMTSLRETARRSRFYLGEVLVSEAKVQVQGSVGLGIIAGDDERAAWELAVIDAAITAGLEETKGWDRMLELEAAAIAERDGAEQARILETRVDFQTMDVD